MKAFAFGVGTVLLIYVSRRSLRMPRSHGFYRFFAWECILGLFLLNVDYWFYKPFAWNQIVAWIFLFISLVPLGFGIHFLRTQGKPVTKREGDSSLLAFEKTTSLVTSGIYKYIRHPLYSSLFLLTWGIFFKHFSVTGIILAISATFFLVFTAKADEMECIQFFDSEYSEYIKRTKRFIPYLF
jgi:protein-S-isoprenylcysteine O-methyltransferase Ste14